MPFLRSALLLLTLPMALTAIELEPWIPEPYLPQFKAAYSPEHFNNVRVGSTKTPYRSTAHSMDFSLFGAVTEQFMVELSFNCIGTSQNHFGMNDAQLTGRYQFWNDITGENFASVTLGTTVSYANWPFVRDLAVFHHGQWEFLTHLSIGREEPCGGAWSSRSWGVVGIGSANEGSVWVFSKLQHERAFSACLRGGAYLGTTVGFGSNPLSIPTFAGYGSLRHRSVDFGVQAEYTVGVYGFIRAEYSFLPWSQNFPIYVNRFAISFYYPIGL